jgi:hypothetical protein
MTWILDGPDWARGHMIRLERDRAVDQASHGPRGWATWAEQFVPFLIMIGTERPDLIKDLVYSEWEWRHRFNGLNPWLRTRQNVYTDLRREYYYPDGYEEPEGTWHLTSIPYERSIQRGAVDMHRWGIDDTDLKREIDYHHHHSLS